MPRPPHILFAGGSTPGKLYPGLAVAAQLIERLPTALVTFAGSDRAAEAHLVRAAGHAYVQFPSRPVPKNALHAVRFVTDNVAGFWAVRWFLKERRVSLVVGLGGMTGAATVRAAISRGLPAVLLEQNVVPSRATRWLAQSATAVCVGFDAARRRLPSAAPTIVTGNPARAEFDEVYRGQRLGDGRVRAWDERRLVIIGGAGGGRSLNEHMPGALARLRDKLTGWRVVHQSGEGQLQETERRYREAGVDALVVAFIDEMAPVMFASDLVVCRPGGTMLAELALTGAAALLIPYPPAREHQRPNAEVYSSAGAAQFIDESETDDSLEDALVERLSLLLSNDALRRRMADKMRQLAHADAAVNVADAICDALVSVTSRLAA
jgi:UDP-N-acetylglucosamine--N-acetylmuramyl-(pentapeptide) pyrophosphoryl-undecaprenol N-acetylglucosamine transferase